jgi:biofilm PGA synthesis lipoprotein PgaB
MTRLFSLASLTLLMLLNCSMASAAGHSAVGLMYHHFGVERYPSTNIRLGQFEQQLQYIADNGFQVLPLMTVLETLQSGKPLPDKTVVITMDDAYKSVYTQAYPRLKKRGWPFTVFVSTDYIDKHYSNYMNWDEMREMQTHGASFGNHSRSHVHLIRRLADEDETQWRQRVSADIRSAQQRLTEELNQVVKVIAYPYGEYNLALADEVKSLGMFGMGQHSGAMGSNSDFRFLPRFPMSEKYGAMDQFRNKIMSLAMPLQQTPDIDPVTTAPRPVLKLQFDKQHARLKNLACYASGQGRIEVQWLNDEEAEVQADSDLPPGRSRYNCTAPSSEAGRFYWFSQPWIRPGSTD